MEIGSRWKDRLTRSNASQTGILEGGALGSHRTGEARLPWQSGVTERTGYFASAVPFSPQLNIGALESCSINELAGSCTSVRVS
jgi:hypothetical protein